MRIRARLSADCWTIARSIDLIDGDAVTHGARPRGSPAGDVNTFTPQLLDQIGMS